MTETFEQFCARMEQIEMDRQYVVGRRTSGNTRSIFTFEGQICMLESEGYRVPDPRSRLQPLVEAVFMAMGPEPRDYWWTDFQTQGKDRAEKIAKHYGGEIEEAFYQEGGWYHFCFDEFENLMKLVWDRHTGEFVKIFGESSVPA